MLGIPPTHPTTWSILKNICKAKYINSNIIARKDRKAIPSDYELKNTKSELKVDL